MCDVTEWEEPLGGGLTKPVRVGDTVRRTAGPWTPAIHALLRHLASVGFDGAPRVLGIDERGREVLTFITGDVGWRPYPEGMFDDGALLAAAQLIRRYHDAVRDFVPPADSAWRFLVGAPREGIVCHNDLAPYNTVYRDGRPCAFIDWDLAAPAPQAWDLAGAAYRFVPLYSDDQCRTLGMPLQPRGRRLRLFCDAYGLKDRQDFVALIRRHVQVCYDSDRLSGKSGAWSLRSLRYIEAEAAEWERTLTG